MHRSFHVGPFPLLHSLFSRYLPTEGIGSRHGNPCVVFGQPGPARSNFYNRPIPPNLFEVVHAFWGQVYTVFLVLLIFILWLKSLDKEESKWNISMKAISSLGRFALISGCLFLVWMRVHHEYIRFLDRLMLFGFSLFGRHFNPAVQTPVYYETFSIVTFTSLSLRSAQRHGKPG